MDDISNWRAKIGTFVCHRSWRAQHVKFSLVELPDVEVLFVFCDFGNTSHYRKCGK